MIKIALASILFYLVVITMTFIIEFSVPTLEDKSEIDNIATYITKKYEKFEDRQHVIENRFGKIYYTVPSHYFMSEIIFYEITDPKDIELIIKLTLEALDVYKVDKVILRFYEKRVWVSNTDRTRWKRGKEHLLKEIIVRRQFS